MRAPILPPPVAPKRRKKRQKSLLLSLLGWGFAAGVVVFLAGSAVAGYLLWHASKDLPSYESLAQYEPPVMTRIHAHDGSLIAEYARERRIFVPMNTIPKLVVGAFLSAEDKRFYEHGGIDFFGVDHVLFASDCPFDKEKGPGYIRATLKVLNEIDLSQEDKEKIFFRNAQKLFGID